MKQLIFLLVFGISFGQVRYLDTLFQNYTVQTVIYDTSATTFSGTTDTLTMDIYTPDGDIVNNRPVIIIAHGGSLVTGSKDYSDAVALAKAFVHRGYVTVSINYRLGFYFSSDAQNEAIKALIRAIQDGKGAIRFMRKSAANGNPYGIDSNKIFFMGISAGAFIGNHIAYLKTLQEFNQYSNDSLITQVGGMTGDANLGHSDSIQIMINLCGGLGLSQWIDANEVPLISMHGTADATVPYAYGSVLGILNVHGSYAMDSSADSKNVPSTLFTWEGAGHVPFSDTVSYMNQTIDFVAQNLYRFMNNQPLLPDTTYQSSPSSIKLIPESQISIFPNPAKDILKITLKKSDLQNSSLTIYNIGGQKIINKTLSARNNRINVSELPKGIYIININKEGRTYNKKLIKE